MRAKIRKGSVGARPQSSEQTVNMSDAGHVEALAAEAVGEPSGDGKDDGGGDEVAGEDPGGFVLDAPREPAMWGRATLAMEVSRTSMKVARVTVMAMAQGL